LRLRQRRSGQPAGAGRAGHVRQLRRLQAWREQSAFCVCACASARVFVQAQEQAGSACVPGGGEGPAVSAARPRSTAGE
jgi:hypothetical protein